MSKLEDGKWGYNIKNPIWEVKKYYNTKEEAIREAKITLDKDRKKPKNLQKFNSYNGFYIGQTNLFTLDNFFIIENEEYIDY